MTTLPTATTAGSEEAYPLLNRSQCSVTLRSDPAVWDSYVAHHQGSSNYHRWVWGSIIERTYGHQPFYLSAVADSGCIRGILPLVLIRSRLFGRSLVSMPFFSYGGILADSADAEEKLFAAAIELARGLKANRIELRQGGACSLDCIRRTPKVTMKVVLPATEDELWCRLTSGLRNKIRKAQKNALTVEWQRTEAVASFYDVFARNMRDLGSPVYPRAWFENIVNSDDGARFVIVRGGTKVVAAGIVTCFKDTIELPWSASLRESRKDYSALLMYWSVLQWAIQHGFAKVDFGRCTPGGGTYEFKRHFGCQELPLNWYYWVPAGDHVQELRPDNPRFRLAVKTWQHLPLSITNRLGPLIVRSIP